MSQNRLNPNYKITTRSEVIGDLILWDFGEYHNLLKSKLISFLKALINIDQRVSFGGV